MSKFTDNQNIKFVDLYQAHPILWDTGADDYKNISKRQEAHESIVKEMGIPGFTVAECKLKIKNVRSHYCQELKKMRESKRLAGDNADKFYTPTLPWFVTLDGFLRKHVQQNAKLKQKRKQPRKQSFSNEIKVEILDAGYNDEGVEICSVNEVDEGMEYTYNPIEEKGEHVMVEDLLIPPKPCEVETVFKQPKLAKHRQASTTLDPGLIAALEKIEEISKNATKKKTEFDVFGTSVAAQLNSMPWEDAIELQMELQQQITKFRLKRYKRPLAAQPSYASDSDYSQEGSEYFIVNE